MTTYLALLRGINVGGAKKVPMKELRALFEGLGHESVLTYLQSGNVVFESRSRTPEKLAAEIEDAVAKTFDLEVSVIIRTRAELDRVAGGNPFPTKGAKPSSLHVMFLAEPASEGSQDAGPRSVAAGRVQSQGSRDLSVVPERFGQVEAHHRLLRDKARNPRHGEELEHGRQGPRPDARTLKPPTGSAHSRFLEVGFEIFSFSRRSEFYCY